MDEVALPTTTDDHRGPGDEFDLQLESVGDQLDQLERWVGTSSLDLGDVAGAGKAWARLTMNVGSVCSVFGRKRVGKPIRMCGAPV